MNVTLCDFLYTEKWGTSLNPKPSWPTQGEKSGITTMCSLHGMPGRNEKAVNDLTKFLDVCSCLSLWHIHSSILACLGDCRRNILEQEGTFSEHINRSFSASKFSSHFYWGYPSFFTKHLCIEFLFLSWTFFVFFFLLC